MTTKAIEAGARADLLPCPFCNKSPAFGRTSEPDNVTIGCNNDDCLVQLCMVSDIPEDEAITAWNTRALASGELVPASAVAAERERCAAVADKKAAALLDTGERLSVASQATKPMYTEADLHEQAGTAIKGVAASLRALEPGPASGEFVVGWRDISTAPNDGSDIIVYRPKFDRDYIPQVGVDYWMTKGVIVPTWAKSRKDCQPTHWMPFPAPPTMLNAATKDGERA